MKLETLKKVLSLGETQSTEFKTGYKLVIAGKQVCAFLNSGGGYLICGVDEKNSIIGLRLDSDIKQLELELVQRIVPKAPFFFETHMVEGKEVLVIEVPAGKDIPYSFSNDIFVRIGDKTVKADQ